MQIPVPFSLEFKPMFEKDFQVVPSKMALLNVDMQNCFVHGQPTSAPDGLELVERINKLAAS